MRRWAVTIGAAALMGAISVDAATLGKICKDNSECPDGSSCVAGDSAISVQRCVAGTPCGGSNLGACPGDEESGQLACIWRPDSKCYKGSGCVEIEGNYGIYKCISLDRCDEYFTATSGSNDTCSGSCNVNGKQCNGRGTCQLTTESTTTPEFECACESGWDGDRCDNVVGDVCMMDVGQCGDHGSCVSNACKCTDGYTGVQCQIPPASSSSSSGSISGSSSGVPKPSSSPTSAPNSSASKAGTDDGVEDKGSKTSALVIIMAVLVALIVVGAIIFVVLARRRRRQQEAADHSNFNRTDSVLAGGAGENARSGPPTPKQKIVIM